MKLRPVYLGVLLVVLAAPRLAAAGDLERLVDKADRAYRGKTSAGIFTMKIHTKSYDRKYQIVVWDSSHGTDRTLVKLLGPALWRGYGTLKIGDKLKLFNPNTNHVTVVGQSMLGDSWMGSHFSNDDLVKETRMSRDFTSHLVKKWRAQSPLGQATYYRVRLSPKPTAPVAWHRVMYELYELGDNVVPVKVDYYRRARQGRPSRTMAFSDVGDLGKRKLPRTMKVTVANKPGEYTAIYYKKLVLGVRIPSSKFTESALRR